MVSTRDHELGQATSGKQPDVLIVGGGINGVGLFRELALQGLRVLLVEKGDFCSGSSAAPSRMIHGGLRYLEYGETGLVRESLRERDALLRNAPHYVQPIETVVPVYSWLKGLLSAPTKFLRGKGRPTQRGAVVVMIGLTFYDMFTRASREVPKRSFASRARTLRALPDLDPSIVASATYWDAQISYPERLALELVQDGEAASETATALNYVSLQRLDASGALVRDQLTGAEATVRPRVVINATGGWIDLTNGAMGARTKSVDGVKGSHLVIEDPELRDSLDGRLVYFENSDRRICIVFPWQGKVLAGSTEIPLADPDEAVCTPDEARYILDSLGELFPGHSIGPGSIVSTFSGVRPLLAGDRETENEMSRAHSALPVRIPGVDVPVYSMAGGKWTTFRSFSEEMADIVLEQLSEPRRASSSELAIGGGRDYPSDPAAIEAWLVRVESQTGLPRERLEQLLERYGTTAAAIAEALSQDGDRPLEHCAEYSTGEVRWILEHDRVRRLDDLVLRRTTLALLGHVSGRLLEELAQLCAEPLGLSISEQQEE